jgi:hypothetical protein
MRLRCAGVRWKMMVNQTQARSDRTAHHRVAQSESMSRMVQRKDGACRKIKNQRCM